jgi:hypothetical protein
MTCPPFIHEALASFAVCVDTGQGISVATQALYPSNTSVSLLITGGPSACIVSDEGHAIAEIAAHGFEIQNPESFLRPFAAPRGLRLNGPTIYSPPIDADALPTAISLVSAASSLAAFWAVRTIRPKSRRDLRRELRELLEGYFSRERLKPEYHLAGFSGRTYRFEFMAEIAGARRLIIDGVFPDAQAINGRAIAHIDVAKLNQPEIIQRLVYDDQDNWPASDINLLRMAAELVPLTLLGPNLGALVIGKVGGN